MKRLVILRPEPGASASVALAEEWGIEAIAIPLFDVRAVPWSAPDPCGFDAIVATSANAFRHGGTELARLSSLPVNAVGEATARAARSVGFAVANIGTGGAGSLAAQLPEGRLLHLCGAHVHQIPETTAITVYESAAIEPPPALDRIGHAIIAVHSPRAGSRLAELVTERSSVTIAAISPAAAAATGDGWAEVAIADRPRDDALLELAARLCQKASQ